MPTPWEDSIRNRTPKQLTVFATANVTGRWRKAFDDALAEFKKLSTKHGLGVDVVSPQNVAAPDPNGEGGAEVQFDVGEGDLQYTAFGTTYEIKNFSGTSLHGATKILYRQFGDQPKRIRRAFIFVPKTPMIDASIKVGPDKFKQVAREAGHGIKMFIALHELIHACGLDNSDHTRFGPGADVLIDHPQTFSGPFDKPDDDKLLLHLAHPKPNVFSPPVFLTKTTADKIIANWK